MHKFSHTEVFTIWNPSHENKFHKINNYLILTKNYGFLRKHRSENWLWICEISKKTFFAEHLWATASENPSSTIDKLRIYVSVFANFSCWWGISCFFFRTKTLSLGKIMKNIRGLELVASLSSGYKASSEKFFY